MIILDSDASNKLKASWDRDNKRLLASHRWTGLLVTGESVMIQHGTFTSLLSPNRARSSVKQHEWLHTVQIPCCDTRWPDPGAAQYRDFKLHSYCPNALLTAFFTVESVLSLVKLAVKLKQWNNGCSYVGEVTSWGYFLLHWQNSSCYMSRHYKYFKPSIEVIL